ncbi:MAG TPA: protein-glutamate O-methyltransferase CheR [Azospirillum sp.]|nr:protein-glutamate O-methyltransferase CheR [Azospirillum sp.]
MTGATAVLGDPAFAPLKDLVIRRTGLAYYADKDAALAERVRRRIAALGLPDCRAYLGVLERERAGGAEFQALVNEIAIGETFFFRYLEQFEALRALVIPECLRRNAGVRALRVWSAGCSIGAEAHSVEILLKRAFGAELEGWSVSIMGTDINHAFLAQARAAVYGDWAMRGVPDDVRAACFEPGDGGWRLKAAYREWTRFSYFNLAETALPAYAEGLAGFDVVLCRNVMIYFDEPSRARLVRGLRDTLVDGGWLLVGHAEAGVELSALFTPVAVPGATLYRKPHPLCTPAPPPPRVAPEPLPTPRTPPRRAAPAPPMAEPVPVLIGPTLDDLVALADRGAWPDALEACEALVEREPMNAAVHYYRGLIEEQLGVGDPVAAFRRALYLDHDLALAQYHLALVHWRRGQAEAARRHFRGARLSLAGRSPDAPVAHGRGLSVRELAAMIDLWLPVGGER